MPSVVSPTVKARSSARRTVPAVKIRRLQRKTEAVDQSAKVAADWRYVYKGSALDRPPAAWTGEQLKACLKEHRVKIPSGSRKKDMIVLVSKYVLKLSDYEVDGVADGVAEEE